MVQKRSASRIGRERKSLADLVFNQIYRSIKSGAYVVDEQLPTEADLCAEFEVSRPVIREALKKLRDQNLIYSRHGVGSFVRQNGVKEPLGFTPLENLTDLRRCYEFREIIEPAAAAAAAERRTEMELTDIANALAELKDATKRGRHQVDSDFIFHLAIAKASANPYLITSMESLKDHIAVGMTFHGVSVKHETKGLDNVYAEHEAIYNAIKHRDPESARFLMRSHLAGSSARVLSL